MRIRTLALAWITLTLVGCVRIHYSPAPGCIRYIGLAPMGGCSGTTVIQDLAVFPETDCLTIDANNCNGGVLEIANRCTDTLAIGGIEIEPGETISADLVEDDGGYALVRVAGNFSGYEPSADVGVKLSGHLGDRAIRVTYTKTAPLCD